MSFRCRIAEHALDPASELEALVQATGGAGAVVSFVGLARQTGAEGEPVERLVLEHHPQLTRRSLDKIVLDARECFDVECIHVVHRSGEVPAREPIVFAGATAVHRRIAFDAADYVMDRLKTEAIFWKREEGSAGCRWIEASDGDRAARLRWA